MDIEEIPTSNLDDMVEVFNKKLISALDHHALEKKQKNNKMSNNIFVYWHRGKKLKKKKQEKKNACGINIGPHDHGTH